METTIDNFIATSLRSSGIVVGNLATPLGDKETKEKDYICPKPNRTRDITFESRKNSTAIKNVKYHEAFQSWNR